MLYKKPQITNNRINFKKQLSEKQLEIFNIPEIKIDSFDTIHQNKFQVVCFMNRLEVYSFQKMAILLSLSLKNSKKCKIKVGS